MLFWSRRLPVVVALGAALLIACGSDDQPGSADPLHHDSGTTTDGAANDATMGGDGGADGGADSTADVAIRDVTTEVVIEDSGAVVDAPAKDAEDEFELPDGGCGPKTNYSNSGDGGASTCGIGQTYMCQGAQYVIDCNCPSSTCTCTRNGTVVGPTILYGGCNTCTMPDFAFLAIDCTVPY